MWCICIKQATHRAVVYVIEDIKHNKLALSLALILIYVRHHFSYTAQSLLKRSIVLVTFVSVLQNVWNSDVTTNVTYTCLSQEKNKEKHSYNVGLTYY